jgi:hypothetical protein
MDWFNVVAAIGLIMTLFVLFLIAKELFKTIKDSVSGRKSDKCNLD